MKSFFLRWLSRSLAGTLVSGVVSTASLAVVATLIFCLVSVSMSIKAQLGKELKAYGANLIVLPRSAPLRFGLGSFQLGAVSGESALRSRDIDALTSGLSGAVESFAPALVVGARVRGREVGASGYPFEKLRGLNPLWRVSPRWPRGGGEAMIGSLLAEQLGVKPGDEIEVEIGGRKAGVTVAAVVETGGAEDMNLFLPLALTQELAGRPGEVSVVLVRADFGGRSADETARMIEAAIPNAEARTLRQVAGAEENLLSKVTRLLWLATLAVGAATAFTVAGTLGVLLLSRRREIGLCLALGATTGRLWTLFMCEAAVSGLVGGVAGCVPGAIVSKIVTKSVFGAPAELGIAAGLLAVAVPLCISLASSVWPVRNALRVSPSGILREQ